MKDAKTVQEVHEWIKSHKVVGEDMPSVLTCRKLYRRAVSKARKNLERLKDFLW